MGWIWGMTPCYIFLVYILLLRSTRVNYHFKGWGAPENSYGHILQLSLILRAVLSVSHLEDEILSVRRP